MNADELLEALEKAKATRVSVYLHADRVGSLYRQKVSRINRVITSKELKPEFAAGVGNILGIKISAKKGISADLDISLEDKALLVQIFEEERGNLQSVDDEGIRNGELLSYLGKSRITFDDEDVTKDTSMLPQNLSEKVQEIRAFQARDAEKGTIVWSSKSKKYLASIAYREFVVDIGTARSYPEGIYGILGTKEDDTEGLLTISPRWIWYEEENDNP